MLRKFRTAVVLVVLAFSLVSCQRLDSDEATALFADCLSRNGVEAQDVRVTMSGGSIEGISVVVISEGDVPYERLEDACIEEVESQ